MKKVLIIVALLVSAVSFTKAQGGGGQTRTPEENAAAAFERQSVAALSLTADQKAKATPILVAFYKAQTDMTTKATAAGTDRQTLMADPKYVALRTDAEKALLAAVVLTADQKKAYDAALATAKERNPTASTVIISAGGGGRGAQGGGGGGQGGGAPRPAGQ